MEDGSSLVLCCECFMVDENERAHLYGSGRVKLGGLFITLASLAVQLDK